MNRKKRFFAVLKEEGPTLVLLLFGSACWTVGLTAATLRGQVFMRESQMPAVDIRVVCGAGRTSAALTDAEGRFTISDLPAGPCSISASVSGLLVDDELFDLPENDLSISIELHDAGEQCGCLVRAGDIPPTIVYSGLVIEQDGQPLANVMVEVDDLAGHISVFTAPDGEFRTEVTRDGAKHIQFSAPGYPIVRLHVPCEEEADKLKVRMRRR